MPVVKIEPTKEHSVPYDTTAQKTETLLDEIAVAGNTAELLVDLGAPLDVSEKDAAKEKELLNAVASAKKPANLKTPSTAFAAAAFLRTYGQQLAMDAASARAAITNKLMEIANCGDARYELKALELLGKHSDIGIFTERSEITVNYKDPDDLEKAIKDRVKRLLNATVVNEVPLAQSLGAEKASSSLLAELDDTEEGIEEVIEEDDISL